MDDRLCFKQEEIVIIWAAVFCLKFNIFGSVNYEIQTCIYIAYLFVNQLPTPFLGVTHATAVSTAWLLQMCQHIVINNINLLGY